MVAHLSHCESVQLPCGRMHTPTDILTHTHTQVGSCPYGPRTPGEARSPGHHFRDYGPAQNKLLTSLHARTHTHTHPHVHRHARTHKPAHTHTHARTHTHTHTRMHARTHTHTTMSQYPLCCLCLWGSLSRWLPSPSPTQTCRALYQRGPPARNRLLHLLYCSKCGRKFETEELERVCPPASLPPSLPPYLSVSLSSLYLPLSPHSHTAIHSLCVLHFLLVG